MACAAGKDVYVEKPMTLFIDEGSGWSRPRASTNASWWWARSGGTARHVAEAKMMIESGQLGKIHSVRDRLLPQHLPGLRQDARRAPAAGLRLRHVARPGARSSPYKPHRGLYHFRWFWDYSGGQMTNLGAHDIDMVHYFMGANAPTQVYSAGGRYALEDDCETPDLQDTVFTYPGFTMLYSVREANARPDITGIRSGHQGRYHPFRRQLRVILGNERRPKPDPGWDGHPPGGPSGSNTQPTPWIEAAKDRPKTDDVMPVNKRNWLDCIRTRKQPFADAEDGHRVATACHLSNISLRLGRMLRWDPVKEDIIGDREASAMLVRPYRKPWDDVLASLKLT